MNETRRFVALDAFRGLTIAAMILVNTPGSWRYVYSPLRHAEWHGCTPTDLVFPFFLFIVGVAMRFSFKKFEYKLTKEAFLKLLKRTLLIFAVGLFLNAFPFHRSLADLRILGVLQRIALAYGFAAVLSLVLKPKQIIIAIVVLLFGYWGLLWGLGGIDPYGLETNIVRTIDLKILGENHIWHGHGIAFDPEGLMSTLPAIVTALLGYLVGFQIQSRKNGSYLWQLLAYGIIGILLGLLWHLVFPINKALWTSSFVLYTAGFAIVLLTCFIWLIDVKDVKTWAHPLIVFGMNPLFVYSLSIIWVKMIIYVVKIPLQDDTSITLYAWLYQHIFAPLFGNMNGSMLFALAHVIVFWLVSLILYKRKIFIKI
ncbi:DUF5009 domain-containing protein [candidate division KSB1 bacterium]|nr:DUF5009 domain-containing protein [candidate division KSB1 bacterium]